MSNTKNYKISKASIVFYVASVVFLGIAAFYIYTTYVSVSSYTGTDLEIRDILNAYFTTCAPFFAYAFGCYGIGLVISKIATLNEVLALCLKDALEETKTEEEVCEISNSIDMEKEKASSKETELNSNTTTDLNE